MCELLANAAHKSSAACTVRVVQADVLTIERPTWRGWLHTFAFIAAIPAGVLLIVAADRAAGRTAAAIYTGTLLAVFGTSAAYHRLAQSPRARQIMRRLDHSMIYLLIAGTYVPLCIIALPGNWGIPLLAVVGGIGLVGMIIKLAYVVRLQWLGDTLYPVMGWAAIVAAPALSSHLTPAQLGLVLAGGVAYTLGFPVLMLRRPDPWPRVFGYHEIWHGFTIVAAVLHFGAVATVVA